MMKEQPAWLNDLYGYVRCPHCGHRFKREEMFVAQRKGLVVVLGCECARCGGNSATFVISAKGQEDEAPPAAQGIDTQTVFDAHDALKREGVRLEDIIGKPDRDP
jgi:hypothetical protein